MVEQPQKRVTPRVTSCAQLVERSNVASRMLIPCLRVTPPYGVSLRSNVLCKLLDNRIKIGHRRTASSVV
jgi:hypothetical protein